MCKADLVSMLNLDVREENIYASSHLIISKNISSLDLFDALVEQLSYENDIYIDTEEMLDEKDLTYTERDLCAVCDLILEYASNVQDNTKEIQVWFD